MQCVQGFNSEVGESGHSENRLTTAIILGIYMPAVKRHLEGVG